MENFSPKEIIEAHARTMRREIRNYTAATDGDYLLNWLERDVQWMGEEMGKAQVYAEHLAERERLVAQKEKEIGNWESRVHAVSNHLLDARRFLEAGRPQEAVEILEMLPHFARTGRFPAAPEEN